MKFYGKEKAHHYFAQRNFDRLTADVEYRQLKGEKATISSVASEMIKDFLKEHSREIEALRKLKSTLAS